MKTWVEISRSALRYNLAVLSGAAKPAKVIAVIKSNAYGHGLGVVAKALGTLPAWFGVDSVEEGIALRRLGVKRPILVIGYVLEGLLDICVENSLSFVVYNIESLKKISRIKAKKGAFRIHLPIETGTTREGFSLKELSAILTCIKQAPSIHLEGTYMHFSDVERAKKSSYAQLQLQNYWKALHLISAWGMSPGLRHTASSAAVLLRPDARFDLVRPGISLYGLWPSQDVRDAIHVHTKLRPVLTWKTVIAQVKDVQKGITVGYDRTERLKRHSKIAVLPVGYSDGIDRKYSSRGYALIRGHRCKILGRICMNMCMVDVTDVPGVRPNDEVVLIGKQKNQEISAESFAETIGTINYEVVTRINPLIERRLVR
ncbi:MAG: hypothetical protein RL141_757 [Candidatus Parcubacteria bacterium]|jgi:alanine racemase